MHRLAWFSAAVLGVAALALPRPVLAQEQPTASLLRSSVAEGVRDGFPGAVDRIIRARIDALDVVNVRGQVALDISEVQLALGCIGETPACLAQVAEQVDVQILLLPNIDVAGDGLMLSIARFDAAGDGTIRRVATRSTEDDAETEILDSVDGLLRELFDLPAAAPVVDDPPDDTTDAGNNDTGAPIEGPGPATPASGPDIAGPAILLAVGGAALIGGAIAGGVYLGEADAYAQPASTPAEVAERDASRASAESAALAANILFIGGGVVAAAGVAWLIVALVDSGGESETASVAPFVTPNAAGLLVQGSFPEGR